MSVKVELSDVERTAAGLAVAYLLTAGDGGRVHLVAVTPQFGDRTITVGGVGRHTVANVQGCGRATLLWTPANPTDYSLIVDGDATLQDADADLGADAGVDRGGEERASERTEPAVISIVPTKAILHRPAVDPAGRRVGNDCVDVAPR